MVQESLVHALKRRRNREKFQRTQTLTTTTTPAIKPYLQMMNIQPEHHRTSLPGYKLYDRILRPYGSGICNTHIETTLIYEKKDKTQAGGFIKNIPTVMRSLKLMLHKPSLRQ